MIPLLVLSMVMVYSQMDISELEKKINKLLKTERKPLQLW